MGGVAWTEEEDHLLKKCIEQYGEGKWHRIPSLAGLNRCRKSCRLRWLNYLRPNIRRGSFAAEEVDLIIKLHKLLGNRWSLIAGRLPGRTANDVKNYWNCHLSKRLNSATTNNHEPHEVVAPNQMTKAAISNDNNNAQNLININATPSFLIKPKSPDYGAIFNFQLPLDIDQSGSTSSTMLLQHNITEQDGIVQLQEGAFHGDQMLPKVELYNEYPILMHQQEPFCDDGLGAGFGFEQAKLDTTCDDESSSSGGKWDLDDLILDVDLWSESF